MQSELLIFGKPIPVYGLLGCLGVLLGLLSVVLRCPRFGLSRDDGAYIYVFGAIGAMLGAKLLYLLLCVGDLIADLALIKTQPEIFVAKYLSGGMVFYGGLFGAIFAAWLSARMYKQKLNSFFPVLVPAIALAHAIARVGCFVSGCCYGTETACSIAVTYTNSAVAPLGVPLIPVQLFEAAGELLIFAFLLWYSNHAKKREYIVCAYLFLYAPLRFVLEFFRGDVARGSFLWLSTSQWLSILTVLAAAAYIIYTRKKSKPNCA